MKYRFPMDSSEVKNKFLKYFGIVNPSPYIDNLLSAVFHQFIIDMGNFDDYLHSKFVDYDDKGSESISMEDLIEKEYGKDARKFINDLLG